MDASGLLDCQTPVDFWISWEGGEVALGRNNYPDSRLISYTPTNMEPVRALGVATGPSSTGVWDFSRQDGETISLSLPPMIFSFNPVFCK